MGFCFSNFLGDSRASPSVMRQCYLVHGLCRTQRLLSSDFGCRREGGANIGLCPFMAGSVGCVVSQVNWSRLAHVHKGFENQGQESINAEFYDNIRTQWLFRN